MVPLAELMLLHVPRRYVPLTVPLIVWTWVLNSRSVMEEVSVLAVMEPDFVRMRREGALFSESAPLGEMSTSTVPETVWRERRSARG